MALEIKRSWINIEEELSIIRQCELLDLPRSSWYYQSVGESEENLELMRRIDEQFTKTPFYGSRRLTAWLKTKKYEVNRKRVRRLMSLMGLEPIYPRPRTSQGNSEHEKYPYLLEGLLIVRPNQVWSTDITYIRLRHGFVYLVAIMDWFSRYVLSWQVSNTLDSWFCLEALERALSTGKPDIFNTDQGAQFTSKDFTSRLKREKIQISMDGRGRALDHVFVERLWRSVKYEEVYIKDYVEVLDALDGLGYYFPFYNNERLHQALKYRTPWQVHFGLLPTEKPPYVH